ncbi:hypothetical protein U14_00043 [Candidatus Moduliflexus flocculans]|uniref:Uncharacterized protein n=1 Tax=Candidatus Moduliflexus flocculans TaxID=1499966 RepID=A0A0S6VPH6_9BACT|nr:hypothetical protein U14_00043 [Candidatus Moduliflexus flocculans]
MKTNILIPEEQLISKAIDILIRTLGPVEASRFLALPQHKRIDSVKRHQQWQDSLKKDEFFEKVFQE